MTSNETVGGHARGRETVGTYTRKRPIKRGHRPPSIPTELLDDMLQLRVDGLSYSEIAADLERRGELSPTGKPAWTVSMVKNALGQYALTLIVEQLRAEQPANGSG